MENTYIGLDIGGTKILGALFNEEGQILKKEKTSTRASKGAERIIQKISKVVDALLDSENQEETHALNAIGLGVPGIIKEGVNLNLLIIRDEETQIEKTIAYNLSYEIEKILRTHLNKQVVISLLVEEDLK